MEVVTAKERFLAALSPASALAGIYFAPPVLAVPIVMYLFSRWKSMRFSQVYALRVIDLFLTILIYLLLVAALYFVLKALTQDAGIQIGLLDRDVWSPLLTVVLTLFLVISNIMAITFSLSGKMYRFYFSFKTIERLSGITA